MRYLLIIFILLIMHSCTPIDNGKNLAFNQDLSGVVLRKYLVKWDHNTACISTNKIDEIAIDRWCHNNNFWDNLQPGDSIYKPSGTLDMWLIKKNGEKILYKHYN